MDDKQDSVTYSISASLLLLIGICSMRTKESGIGTWEPVVLTVESKSELAFGSSESNKDVVI